MPERRPSHQSLDDVLREIAREKEEQKRVASTPIEPATHAAILTLLGSIQEEKHHQSPGESTSILTHSNLNERQKKLPTLSLRMIGSIAAMFVMIAGVGAATTLSQQSQDVRNQAYDGKTAQLANRPVVTPSPAEYEMIEDWAQVPETREEKKSAGIRPTVLAGGFLIALAVVVLLGLFVWLFAV